LFWAASSRVELRGGRICANEWKERRMREAKAKYKLDILLFDNLINFRLIYHFPVNIHTLNLIQWSSLHKYLNNNRKLLDLELELCIEWPFAINFD
jgi:hypothetical protein